MDPLQNPDFGNSDNFDVLDLKRRVSPRLLQIAGVSGVGIRGGTLTVYLSEDSEAVRREVGAELESIRANIPVNYVVSGVFRAGRARQRSA